MTRGASLVFVAWAVVAAAWLTTLQTDITAGNDSLTHPSGLVDPLMDDAGEFVVAWHTWGVTHPPGYPLLNAVGNVMARGFTAAGASPAAAASLVSWVIMLAALWQAAALVRAAAPGGAPAAALVLPAFGELVWLYACVAEAYALGLLLALVSVRLALRVGDRPAAGRRVLALGLAFGLAVGHHRTLLAVVPAVAVAAWPAWAPGSLRRGAPGAPRAAEWRAALGLAVASLGVYVYLPLAAASGSPWIYGRSPATLDGLLDAILAREYAGQLAPPADPAAIAAALASRVAFLAREMTLPGLALGVIGLVVAAGHRSTRRPAFVAASLAAGYLVAPAGQHLVIGTHLLVMVAAVALAIGWGLGIAAATHRWRHAGAAGLALSIAVAAGAWRAHHADVVTYTQDRSGRHLLDAVAAVARPGGDPMSDAAGGDMTAPTGTGPTVVESWSPRYFALAYGKWVTGEIAGVRLLDVRTDLGGWAGPYPAVVYTTPQMVRIATLERWSERLGATAVVESAGDGLVAVRAAPRLADGSPITASLRSPVVIDAARAWWTAEGDIRLWIEWRAARAPGRDAHVFVHATDRAVIDDPTDIVAQADRDHPVYGLSPISRWSAGQRVRDDYRIAAPAAGWTPRRPRWVEVGLYRVEADGAFLNLVRRRIAPDPGRQTTP